MEADNITSIKYNPSQAMSIDDIAKVMYDPNAEMYMKNYEALASIAGNTAAAGNAAENYINSLEFLPEDTSVDKEKVIEDINNMVYADWDNEKSPKNLGRFVSEFGKRIGPSGDVGKAVARYQNRMAWEANEKASLDTLPDEDRELLRKEYNDKMIGLDNTSEMGLFTLSDKIAKLPDFNEILSDNNIRAIVNYGNMDMSEETFRQQGLSYDNAKRVINGIVSQDGDIQNWLDQYNRIHGTNYNLDNCVSGYDGNGHVRIKNDLPNELKSAISDAWVRATEGQNQYRHVTVPTEKNSSKSTGSGSGSGGSKTTTTNNNLFTVKHLLYGTAFGDMDYVCKNHIDRVIGDNTDFFFTGDNKFSTVFTVETKDGKTHITNGSELTVDNRPNNGYYPVRKDGKMIAAIDNPKNLGNVISSLNNYIESRNDVVNDAVFESFETDMDAKKIQAFLPKFNILNETSNGDFIYDDATESIDQSNIEMINGISLSSPFGDVMFLATIKDGDNTKNVILVPKNDTDLPKICNTILSTSKGMSDLAKWYLSNPEFIKMASMLSRSAIQKDNNGNFYKEIKLNYNNMKECGVNLPCNFWNYSLRMNLVDKNNPDGVPNIYFVDRDGKMATSCKIGDMNNFFQAMYIYMDMYENPDNVNEGDSLVDYINNKMFGITMEENMPGFDWDPETPGVQSPYMQSAEHIGMYNPNIYGEFGQLYKIMEDLDKNTKNKFATAKYAEVKANKMVPIENEAIKTGDIVEHNGKFYMIITYGNGYILIDDDGKFFKKYGTVEQSLHNTTYKVYKGISRGSIVS